MWVVRKTCSCKRGPDVLEGAEYGKYVFMTASTAGQVNRGLHHVVVGML
jgi:hypothetical protein